MAEKEILEAYGLTNAGALITAAEAAGVPLWIAAAVLEKESGGANVYGSDRGGVYAPGDPERPVPNVVTESNYRRFQERVLGGATSNGVGPAQITYPGFIRDAAARGIRLWIPEENIRYGMDLIAGYLRGQDSMDAIQEAGRRYNGALAYGVDLAARALAWRGRLQEENMTYPRNNGTPAGVAALETALRKERHDIYCGPSMAGRQCVRGKHGHLWDPKNGVVSTHYVDKNGGWSGPHVGGAVDFGKDPASGAGISTYEKAHVDDTVRILDRLGWGVMWGVVLHYDHAHADYIRANRNIVYQGPNAGFTVAQILRVQRDLKTLGLYRGSLDGLREKGTITAIKAAQKKAGLKRDGLPGSDTRAAIARMLRAAATPPAPKPGEGIEEFSAEHIGWVQTSLKTLGFYKDEVDRRPGPNTIAAVAAFQKKIGLEPDGLPGGDTTDAIKAALAALPKPFRGERVSGPNRYATAAELSELLPQEDTVYLAASGTDDAAAAARLGVVLLANPGSDRLPAATAERLKEMKPKHIIVVGGVAVIPDEQASAAYAAAGLKE